MQFVDVIMEVLDELGATDAHPRHRSDFNPIVKSRWKKYGHYIDPNKDFGQQVSAELHRFSSDTAKWKRNAAEGRIAPDLFKMHRGGYWSVRDGAPHGIARLA